MGKDFYQGKKVLVTGGTGLVGMQLVPMLIRRGAIVRVVALDAPKERPIGAHYYKGDLTRSGVVRAAVNDMNIVFHLACVKGSPKSVREKPASHFVPMILMNTLIMEEARLAGVQHFLYTSTNGIYTPADTLYEDDLWNGMPSNNDWFAGWAKRMGEVQALAYQIEHQWENISIIRPSNIYGPHDTFEGEAAMVIPSLIRRAVRGENPLTVWGDGSPIRDFIHAKDVARAMMFVVENKISIPMNVGSGGGGTSIKELVEIITANVHPEPRIMWDPEKPMGDKKRVLDTARITSYGFRPEISLKDGIRETMQWYSRKLEKAANEECVAAGSR